MTEPRTDHETELLEAVKAGFIDEIKKLLNLNLINLNDERYFDYYLIIEALDSQYVELAKLLIEKDFRVYKACKSNQERTVLHAAAAIQSKDKELIKILIEKGASPDILSYDGENMTPLHIAIDGYRLCTIQLFLSQCNVKSLDEHYFLHYAIIQDKAQVVVQLIKKGLSMKKKSKENLTPFCVAFKNKNFKILDILLLHDDISQHDIKMLEEHHLLHYAVILEKSELVQQLIKKGLSIKKKNKENLTPFCIALNNNNFEILDILFSQCYVKDVNSNSYDDLAPVFMASIYGNLQFIQEYADFGLPINIPLMLSTNSWSSLNSCPGSTLLHIAVEHVKLKVVTLLLNLGADITVKNDNGLSPLHLAFEMKEKATWKTWQDSNDNNSIIDLILKANIKLKSNPVNSYGLSHYHIACSRDDPTVVEHFLKLGTPVDKPVNSEYLFNKRFSPLHFAAKFGCQKTVELLLKNGANIRQKNFEKMTALHIAVKECYTDIVRLLLQYAADIACKDGHGNTPLHCAFENTNGEIIDLLLAVPNAAHSNPVNSEGVSHFHIACTRNNLDVVKNFIENGVDLDSCIFANNNSYFRNYSGYSPLHCAIFKLRAKIIQLLLHKGANINIKNGFGQTPVDLAYDTVVLEEYCTLDRIQSNRNFVFHRIALAVFDQDEIMLVVSTLAKVRININSRDSIGFTALHVACEQKNFNALEILLMYGADINIEDNEGRSVCCYLYEKYLKNLCREWSSCSDVQKMMNILQKHIIKINCLGLPVNKKVLLSSYKFIGFKTLTGQEKIKFVGDCQTEVQLLRDSNIHANYTLYNVFLNNENILAQLVYKSAFEDLIFSDSLKKKFPSYCYFIELRHQVGMERAQLLPVAKRVLNDLAGLNLPNTCSENIYKYFKNVDLEEFIELLRGILHLKMEDSNDDQLTECRTYKRQKVK